MTTGSFYVTTYRPLVLTAYGRRASETLAIPPFVDASIRREPDFEHERPAITCVCRSGKFAPRLRVGDIVVYLTKRGRWGSLAYPHWRLTGVLAVSDTRATHAAAAAWYRQQQLPLPSDILVPGNAPLPITASARDNRDFKRFDDEAMQREWDRVYQLRTRRHGAVAICRRLHVNLGWQADVVIEDDFTAHFGKVPGTRNPGAMEMARGLAFLQRFRIRVAPSSP